jgi:hypothetical protein
MAIVIAVLALVAAGVALLQARRAARRTAQLTEMYWQLKYDHGELKAAVAPPAEPPPPTATFVPLGAVKRKT